MTEEIITLQALLVKSYIQRNACAHCAGPSGSTFKMTMPSR
jgi:hypothetical protein